MKNILVVEDDSDIRELISFNLELSGYAVSAVDRGEDALKAALETTPDLVLLDIMLPAMNGFEVCDQLKENPQLKDIPVIMLTARTDDEDIIRGLETGADDYITKPFRPKILLARIKTALRRKSDKSESDEKIIHVNGINIDLDRHEVRLGEEKINLSVTEFSILMYLAENPGFVYSRNKIIDRVKGNGYAVSERSVDVQILGIRKKLGEAGKYIETVRGIGYRLISS